jgi:TRAP-type C4-dicarboxylate transport system substrate-binding protein
MMFLTLVLTVFTVMTWLPALVHAQERFTLRTLSGWPRTAFETQNFLAFVETLQKDADQRFPGQLRIDFRGGPEVIPHLRQVEAIRGGLVDLLLTAGSYYTSVMPEIDVLSLTTYTPWEEREVGVNDYLQKIHQQKAGAHYLGRLGTGALFHFFLSRPIQRLDDFKGLRLRGSPTHVPFIRALGAEPVVTAPTEIYTAMERGMVAGYVQPVAPVRDLGLIPVTKFMLQPGFYQPTNPVLVNSAVWNRLPRHLQDLLTEHVKRAEREAIENTRRRVAAEIEGFRKAGITVIELPPADASRFSQIAADAMMEAVLKRSPVEGAALRDMVIKK